MFSKNQIYTTIQYLLCAISILLLILFINKYAKDMLQQIKIINFTASFCVYFFILLIFSILVIIQVNHTFISDNYKNNLINITLTIMIVFLFISIALINAINSPKDISLILRDENNKYAGTLKCHSLNRTEYTMEYDYVTCKLDLSGDVLNSSVKLFKQNKIILTKEINYIYFEAPQSSDYILYEFYVMDNSNLKYYSSGWENQFYSYEDIQNKSKNYLNLLVLLVPLILFSIPGLIASAITIINRKK